MVRALVEAQRFGLDGHDDLVGHVQDGAQNVGGGPAAQGVATAAVSVEVDPSGGVDVDVLDAGQIFDLGEIV